MPSISIPPPPSRLRIGALGLEPRRAADGPAAQLLMQTDPRLPPRLFPRVGTEARPTPARGLVGAPARVLGRHLRVCLDASERSASMKKDRKFFSSVHSNTWKRRRCGHARGSASPTVSLCGAASWCRREAGLKGADEGEYPEVAVPQHLPHHRRRGQLARAAVRLLARVAVRRVAPLVGPAPHEGRREAEARRRAQAHHGAARPTGARRPLGLALTARRWEAPEALEGTEGAVPAWAPV